jgi:hypothetical protein
LIARQRERAHGGCCLHAQWCSHLCAAPPRPAAGIIANLQGEMEAVKERSTKNEALLKNELKSSSSQVGAWAQACTAAGPAAAGRAAGSDPRASPRAVPLHSAHRPVALALLGCTDAPAIIAQPTLPRTPCSSQIEDTTSSYQAAISSLTKQLTEAREANSNNELKFQQRKLVLLQVRLALVAAAGAGDAWG